MSLADPASREADLRPYRRPFARPLVAAWGQWTVREGKVLRVKTPQEGGDGFGEMAPLPGTVRGSFAAAASQSGPEEAFAYWTAHASAAAAVSADGVPTAGLLSLGESLVEALPSSREEGFSTWKLKLGVRTPQEEAPLLETLVHQLRPDERIRLDVNQAWSADDRRFWKPRLRELAPLIEFLEEPFPKATPPEIWFREGDTSPVPLALDESLASIPLSFWIDKGWPGFFILKPSLMGSPDHWLGLVKPVADRVILSSVFETGIGMSALLALAGSFPDRHHGLGTVRYFKDDLGTPMRGNRLFPLTQQEKKSLWNRLSTT